MKINRLLSEGRYKEIHTRFVEHLKYGWRDPQWLFMVVFSRFSGIRKLSKRFYKTPNLEKYLVDTSIFPELDVDRAVSTLRNEGFFPGLKLPKELLSELIEYGKSEYTYGNGNFSKGFLYSDKLKAERKVNQIFSFGNFINVHHNFPLVQKLGADPKIMMIVAKYFGAEPIHVNSRMWWNFITDEKDFDYKRTASFFHYDKDDFNGLRLMFYLTDVDADSGPHICVRTSHRQKKIHHLLSLRQRSDHEIIRAYGEDNIVAFIDSAGTGFFEDPFCFHKGTCPSDKDRLVLTLKYTTSRYSIFNNHVDQSLLKKIV